MENDTPEQYLKMWLSEQIPINDWLRLLDSDPKLERLYNKHVEEYNVRTKDRPKFNKR